MEKELNKKILDNFDKKNIESIDRMINEEMPERFGMFVNESGSGEVTISEQSRKIAVKALLR